MAKSIREILQVVVVVLIRWLIPPAQAGWQPTKRKIDLDIR